MRKTEIALGNFPPSAYALLSEVVVLKWINKKVMVWILGQGTQSPENEVWGHHAVYSDQCPWTEYVNRSNLSEFGINICHQISPKLPLETVLLVEVRNFVVSCTTYYKYGLQNQAFHNSFEVYCRIQYIMIILYVMWIYMHTYVRLNTYLHRNSGIEAIDRKHLKHS